MPRGDLYRRPSAKKRVTSPIWRGIGCIAMFLLPVATFGLTVVFTPIIAKTGLMPYQILGYIKFPSWILRAPVLGVITSFIGGIDNLWLSILLFIAILVILIGVFSFLYTIIMQIIGPPRYSEVDAPPTKYKAKKYTR